MLSGSAFPNRHLCLTFDDGPGAHTAEISSFLRDEGIPATFFLIGRFVPQLPDVVKQLISDGHEIGNHTQNHPNLTQNFVDIREEVAAAHKVISRFIPVGMGPLFFRPPYGLWPTDEDLRARGMPFEGPELDGSYADPIHWDFSGDDWSFWNLAISLDDAAAVDAATKAYSQAERGIVLLHDNSFEAGIAQKNQTFRLIRKLVPKWKSDGFTFVSLRDAYRNGWLGVAA